MRAPRRPICRGSMCATPPAAWCRSSTLGTLKPIVGPETVPHYNNYASALINGGAAPGYSSGQAVAAMERAAATALPRDFAFEWTGITFQELKAGSIATVVFALAIVFVFLILAAQYESWSMPFMVLLAVPLALFGALLALWLRGMQIDVYSQIGFVMLIGLAAKNAILIVEFAKRRREEGLEIVEAAMEAARLRLRPILMTAFAFILGVVPLMIATGRGRGEPPVDRHHGVRRHAGRDHSDPGLRPGLLRGDRDSGGNAACGDEARAGAWRRPCSRRNKIGDQHHAHIGKSALRRRRRRGGRHRDRRCSSTRAARWSATPPGRRRRPRDDGHAGAGGEDRQEDDPDLSRLFGAHRSDPQHHAAGQGLRLYPAAARCRTAPTSRKAICSTRSIRATSRPRSTRPRRRSQRDKAALDYARVNLDRGTTLAKSGYLAKDTFDQRTSAVAAGRSGAGDGSRPRSARPSSISATPKSARRSPAGSAATRRRSAR